MIYTANKVSPLEKTMHLLRTKFKIDYMTYARYSVDCIEWMTSDRKRLNRFLSDENSLNPIDVVDQTSVVDMSRYCSKAFLNYCELQCDHKKQGVTMVLKHNDHFYEHISLSSSDHTVDIKIGLFKMRRCDTPYCHISDTVQIYPDPVIIHNK